MKLEHCTKAYTRDQDKAVPPEETVARVREVLAAQGKDILAETRRIDTGRLDIPVYLSVCGADARSIMPTRKQMGKGASPAQAEASALMELVERYSFFTFWADADNFTEATWSEAQERWPGQIIALEQMLKSVDEDMAAENAREILDLVRWRFCPALDLHRERERMVPLDWFKKLGEFNGSSAGNVAVESVFQGACELVERHVCALADREHPELPTIDPDSIQDPVLAELLGKFTCNGVKVVLKDFTLGQPVPTVAALAWDPTTFPGLSEIVFTAGTASSPAKAAIRALTEVAQLAGDFETGAVYEASGLSKFGALEEAEWLRRGPLAPLDSLPDVSHEDIREELAALCRGLDGLGFTLFSVDTSEPSLALAANYNFVPGFAFRERDRHASLGLFVGRILAEESGLHEAELGLGVLERIYGTETHFLPFFRGMLALRGEEPQRAVRLFEAAEALQPDDENRALAAFYAAYARTLDQDWAGALPGLDRAVALSPEVKEYFNLRGVARFKLEQYQEAASDFSEALNLDRGSAMDLANLGVCHKFMGHKGEALDYLNSALELDPGLDFARTHRDELLAQ